MFEASWPPVVRTLTSATTLFTAALLVPSLAQAQVIPPYETSFSASEGFFTGTLEGQDGWVLDDGEALVGEAGVTLFPATPRTQISRTFTRFAGEDIVFIHFLIRGGAGEPPSNAPEASSPEVFHVALAAEGALGRFYVFDGDGTGSGSWQPTGAVVPLDENLQTLSPVSLTVRMDFARKSFDLYADDALAGFDYGFPRDDPFDFSQFVLRGNPDVEIVLETFYAGASPLGWDNQSGDGIPDQWKLQYSLPLESDLRDEDGDADGLTNIEEFFLGTGPDLADTSRDGLLDGEAVDLGANPLAPSNLFPAPLPFFDDFEVWPEGNIHARGGWHVSPNGSATVTSENRFRGDQGLRLDAAHGEVVVRLDVEANTDSVTWTDLYLDVAAHARSAPPRISQDAAVSFFFDADGGAVAWDGLSGSWVTVDPVTPSAKRDWMRVTVRQDFDGQTWDLWLNAAPAAEGLGFASPRDSYSRLRVTQPERSAILDDVLIGANEPPHLDLDGDGLSDEEEIVLGADPNNPDTSGDGMWDANKALWGFDPTDARDFATLGVEAGGAFSWSTSFEGEEGFLLGPLDGQQGWLASPGSAVSTGPVHDGQQALTIESSATEGLAHRVERYFGLGNERTVWVTIHASPEPGRLPDPGALEGPRSALVAVNAGGYVFAYDGIEERWVNSHFQVDDLEPWIRFDVRLDYRTGRYWLCIDGVLVFRDLGFRDWGLRTLTRLAVQGATGEYSGITGLDTLRVRLEEPSGLDFSGDGLTNDEKRALGLDIFATDTTGDGIPDRWLVQYGLDATNPNIGDMGTGYGLTVRQAFLLGTRPDTGDTDGDGWADFEEYLAATDPLDAASAPEGNGLEGWNVTTVGHGLPTYAFRVDGEYRIAGSGMGTKGSADSFSFAYRPVRGNFEAIARIRAPENLSVADGTASWLTQNGLMARTGLEENAVYSAPFASPFWYWTRFREVPGQEAVGMTLQPLSIGEATHIRMVRVGNSFRHYLSSDGATWFLVSAVSISMPEEILVGMFTSANSSDTWVRGRLAEVLVTELDDQAAWVSDDGAGGTHFDSFAWLGEWDGVGDPDGADLAVRSPSLDELPAAGLQATLALEIAGAAAVETVGEWEVDGSSLVSSGRRGWIEFDIESTAADVYLIEIEGRENNKFRQAVSGFNLKLYLDGEYLGTRNLEAVPEEPGQVYSFTPWLSAGTYRLRILWDGSRSRTHLKLDAVRLHAIAGVDATGNGVKDWVENRLARHVGIQPQAPMFTYVSPLPLEGRDRFNSLGRIEHEALLEGEPGEHRDASRPFAEHPRGELGRDFLALREELSPLGDPVSVVGHRHFLSKQGTEWGTYLSAWSDPVSFVPRRGPGYRFWTDVPLAPLVDNAVTASWQNGVAEERRMVRWIPYNVLEGGSMSLRTGDALLLTAHEGDQESGQVVIQVGGESFETIPASPLVYTFTEPGEYFIEGVYVRTNGRQFSGVLQVSVSDFLFPERPLVYVSRQRTWEATPDLAEPPPFFVADPRLRLQTTGDGAASLRFGSNDNVPMTIAARAGENGPILASLEAENFRLFSSWETYARIIDTLPDGTKLVEMMMILSPVPDDVRVFLEIYVGGILFDDGTIERWLLPEDFDELGQVTFRFIMPEEAISSVCHRTHIYQNETLIGIR